MLLKKFPTGMLLILCMVAMSANAHAAIMANYYVSVSGNDSWPGTENQPFRTIQKARDVIRARTGTWTGDIYVWIRGGTYTLSGTLEFTEADSGKDGHYVAYQAYAGERPVISGGTPITGWSPYQNGIYRASCGSMEFRQLYVNGRKAIRARMPDAGTFHRLVSWNTSNQTIKVNAGELGNVQNLSNGKVEMIVQQYWAESIMRIASVAASGAFKNITVNSTEKNIVFGRTWPLKSPDQAYHFENSLDFLDQEGEWYLDDNSSPHYVYYKPRPGENMAAATVTGPNLETLVRVTGAGLADHAHHLIFEGITFENSNWTRPSYHGNIGLQSQQYSIGNDRCDRPAAAFYITNADHMRLTRNVFRHCGSTGLDIYTSTNNIVVEGNVFHDISGNGMQLGKFSESDAAIATVYNPADTREYCESIIVANNYMYTCGTDYYCSNGIAAGYVRNTSIIHNEITDLANSAISMGWGWNTSVCAMSNNHIEYNLIYDVMKLLCDGAGIYTLGNQGPASTIKYNYIYNTVRSTWATTQYTATYPVASIYLDQGSSGFTIDQNCLVNSRPEWRVNFNGTQSYNTLGTNPSDDPAIINNAGIQPSFQDIKLTDPMPTPPPPPSSPIPTPGLRLWLQADAEEGVIIRDAGNRVNTWGDQSGNTNTAFQTIPSYQPLYIANAINGKPALRFDGTNDRMNITSLTGSMDEFTFILVTKPDGLSDYNQSIGAAGSWGQFLFHSAANGTIYCGTSPAARLTSPGGTMINQEVQQFSFVYTGTDTESSLYKNGTLVADGTLAQTPASWTGFILGAGSSSTLKADVPEIIIYDRILSGAERQTVESYLDNKYGYLSLSSFKSNRTSNMMPPDAFSVYPTPVDDEFYIDLDLENRSPVKVMVYSMGGYLLKQVTFESIPAGKNHLEIDATNLDGGAYIYLIQTDKQLETGKLMVF